MHSTWRGLVVRVGIALVAVFAVSKSSASAASVLVDLRFSDLPDDTGRALARGTNQAFTVQVWARVLGDENVALHLEGLKYVTGSLQSVQGAGGGSIVAGTSGITAVSGFAPAFTTASPGQPGTTQNLTADGVQDWGTTATDNANTIRFNSALNGGADAVTRATPGVRVWQDSAPLDFLVGTFTVTVNAADINPSSSGTTFFRWVNGVGDAPASFQPNGVPPDVTAASTYLSESGNAGNGVAFIVGAPVPEPAGFGVLLCVATAWFGLRRRPLTNA
jgi:hypothetical protein